MIKTINYKHFLASLIVGLPLFVTACANLGNKSIENATYVSVDAKIKDGVTTKEQVRAIFGDPARVFFTGGGFEEWQYVFTKTHMYATNYIPIVNLFRSGGKGYKKTLTIIFNGNVVWHHALSRSPVEMNSNFGGSVIM